MRGINKVILIGNLGQDPDMKYMPDGTALCTFSVACNESWKDKSTGEMKERTEWVNVDVWGNNAEACGKFLSKGKSCYVEGSLRTDKWQDKEGNDRYTTKVKANTVMFLGGGKGQGQEPNQPTPKRDEPQPDFDDDIPF